MIYDKVSIKPGHNHSVILKTRLRVKYSALGFVLFETSHPIPLPILEVLLEAFDKRYPVIGFGILESEFRVHDALFIRNFWVARPHAYLLGHIFVP